MNAIGDYVYRLCRHANGLHALFCSDIELVANGTDSFVGKLVYVESTARTASRYFKSKDIWGINFVEVTKDIFGCYQTDTALARLAERVVPEVLLDDHPFLRTWSRVRRDSIVREVSSTQLRQEYRSVSAPINALIDTLATIARLPVGLVGSTALQFRADSLDIDIVLLPETVHEGRSAVCRINDSFRASQSAYLRYMWPLSFDIGTRHFDIFVCPSRLPDRLHGILGIGDSVSSPEPFNAIVVDDSNCQYGLSEWLLSDGSQLVSTDSATRGRYPVGTRLVGLARHLHAPTGRVVRVLESFGNIATIVDSNYGQTGGVK